MAYDRHILFQTPLLSWQSVTLGEEEEAWSPEYRVDATRLVLPVTRSFECRLGAASFTCDPLSAVWLTPDRAYRMRRPWRRQRSWLIAIDAPVPAGGSIASPKMQARLFQLRTDHLLGRLEPLQLEEALAGLVRDMVPSSCDRRATSRRIVERAKALLASAPEDNATLSEIASKVHVSPFHLARMFRRETGAGLHGYRTALRMTGALARLDEGESDLARLAADLGYASHSHFSSVFRRTFGTPPHQMRTNLTARRIAI